MSRQLWWGHRIPAWLVVIDGQDRPDGTQTEHYVVARTEAEAMKKAQVSIFAVNNTNIQTSALAA